MSEPFGSSSDIAQCPAAAGRHIRQLRCFLHHLVPSSRFDLHIHAISPLHAKPSSIPIPLLLAKPLSSPITLIRLLRHIWTLNGSNSSTLEQPNIPPTALYPTSPRSRVSTQTSKPTISPMCLLVVQNFLRPNQSTSSVPTTRLLHLAVHNVNLFHFYKKSNKFTFPKTPFMAL